MTTMESRERSSLPIMLGAGAALLVAVGMLGYAVTYVPGPLAAPAPPARPVRSAADSPNVATAGTKTGPASAASATRAGERMALAINEGGLLRPYRNGDQA